MQRRKMIPVVLMAMAAGIPAAAFADSETNEIPPFILVAKPRSIESTLNGYRTVSQDGRTEYWMRTMNGYNSGSRVITRTMDGYRANDGSVARREFGGWVVSKGGTNTTIRETLTGYVVGDTHFFRGVNGYSSSVAPSNDLWMGTREKTPVKRMKTSTTSSFRRWDEGGKSKD